MKTRKFKLVVEAEVTVGKGVRIVRSYPAGDIIGFKSTDGRTVKPVINFEVETPAGHLADVAKLEDPRVEVTKCGDRYLVPA